MINLKKLFGCKEEEYLAEIEKLEAENLLLKKNLTVNPKEEYFNNKYPKVNLTYSRYEFDGDYKVDIRNFIQPFDAEIPTVEGSTDDEKALKGLLWVLENIKYVADQLEYSKAEFWSYAYQTLSHKKGDCEDGAILLYNILLKSGIPYWKLRLSAGWVNLNKKKVGHAYLTYYCEASDKWVVLDWCYWPNKLIIENRADYKDESNYLDVWFSWNQKHCFSAGLNKKAKEMVDGK